MTHRSSCSGGHNGGEGHILKDVIVQFCFIFLFQFEPIRGVYCKENGPREPRDDEQDADHYCLMNDEKIHVIILYLSL